MNKTTLTQDNFVAKAIQERIEREGGRIFDELKEQMMNDFTKVLNDKRQSIIADTAVRIARAFEIQNSNDRVIVSFTNFQDRIENK